MHYIVGLLLIAAGVGIVLKSEWILENFGTNSWAEEKLGTSGGSRLFYKLVGIAIIFIGILLVTNLFEGFMEGTVGRLFIH